MCATFQSLQLVNLFYRMKVFEAEDKQILVVKENGKIHAMGAKCTHFGAPLNTGIFCQGKIYCPWHGACFDSKTGNYKYVFCCIHLPLS